MVSINYSAREVCCKIVYYGPGLSGKTTNLQYVHSKVPQGTRGKLISLATEADRTLYFDFLPINIGTINGFQAKFQLYTVPGQVYYNATRKLVLRGVDGLVFVADSQPDKMDENIESLANLEENLREYGYDPDVMPLVIQYNKRDLPGILSVAELDAKLNPIGRPTYEASASLGTGVFDTLKLIIRLVLDKAKTTGSDSMSPQPVTTTAATPTPPPVTPAPVAQVPETPTQVPSQPVSPGSAVATAVAPPQTTLTSTNDGQQPVVEQTPVYRPFPGNKTGGVDRKALPVGFGKPETTEEQLEPSDASIDNQELSSEPSSSNAPQMAPSLRKRSSKKRGFFKRLFGIK